MSARAVPSAATHGGAGLVTGRVVAAGLVMGWLIVCVPLFWAVDATGYLAAGERLNAGGELYALGPGDRWVDIRPGLWDHPFLYPPIWGIAWRLLASPIGLAVWMSVVSFGMIGWLYLVLRHADRRTAVIVGLLSAPFAVLLASGNVAGLILVGMSLARRRNAGILVGVMAAIKIMPAVLIVWFLATRRYREAALAIGAGAVLTLAGYLYDPALTWQYVTEVIPSTHAMGISPAYLSGLPWLTYVLLGFGLAVTWFRRSFGSAVATVVFGSPAVGVASLALLGAGLRHDVAVGQERRGIERPGVGHLRVGDRQP